MPTILLVEDQLVFRETLAEALEDHGYAVIRAGDAPEALAAVDLQSVDMLLLDVSLPGQNGLDLLRVLRSRPASRRIPALFLTAFPRPEALEEASRLGVGDFLVKSEVSLKDLLDRIHQGLAAGSEGPNPPSSRIEPVETRRHIRPALRRWRPQLDRAQARELFLLTSGPCGANELQAHLAIDPVGGRWLRKIGGPEMERKDPRAAIRLMIVRAVVDAAMRSVQPFADIRRLWRRALATGLLAEALVPAEAFATPLQAFLAGFCSQVPWIFALQALENEYGEVKAQAWEDGLPIVGQLAGAFGIDAATLVMETLRGMEIPDPVWTAVMDVQGVKDAAGLWNPSPGGRLLSPVLQLSVLLEPAWHPCVEVRGIDSAEAGWLSHPERLPHLLPGLARNFRELIESDAFPEAGMNDPTRAFPFTGGARRFAYLREPGVLVPDPLELALRQLGDVELHASPEEFLAREDVVRVAWVEPGTAWWDRLRETPRRTVLLHHRPVGRRMALGAHAELLLPAPLAVLDRVLRSRD
ncbi:MAG TPA: response regulator [Fibrobacteria bacterium]|nr:response regulator [Fibrobacteria bacterium]